MSEIIPQDTPIDRATIMDMDTAQLLAYVATLQHRRLAAFNIYMLGLEAKKRVQDQKDADFLVKRLQQFEKLYTSVDKSLTKLEKYATEIQVARLAAGDL